MIRQRIVAGLFVGAALIGVAACGSDSKSSDTTAKAATTTAKADAAATTTAKAGDAASTTDGDDSSTDDSLVGNCVKYQEEFGQITDTSASLPSKATMDDFFDELSGDVPSDMKDDIATLKSAMSDLYSAIDEAGGDLSKAAEDPDVQKAIEALDSPEVNAAGEKMSAWFDAGCPD